MKRRYRILNTFRNVFLALIICFGLMTIISSDSSDDDDNVTVDSAPIEGVWAWNSMTEYNQGCTTMVFPFMYGEIEVNAYIKITGDTIAMYGKSEGSPDPQIPNGTFSCPDMNMSYTSDGSTITIVTGNDVLADSGDQFDVSISGSELTLSFGDEQGCVEELVMTKSTESEIANAIPACQFIGLIAF